jgi:hypothetical protein
MDTPASQHKANQLQERPRAKKLSKSATPRKIGPEIPSLKQLLQNAHPQAICDPNPKQKSKVMRLYFLALN